MLLTPKQIHNKFNLSRSTLLTWEKEGLLCPVKTPKGTRRYPQNDLEHILHLNKENSNTAQEVLIVYARVSTKKQQQYLKNQELRLQ